MGEKVFNRTTVSWAFYDFANSAYALLISGVAFQIYFKKIAFQSSQGSADLWWALTVSMSILVSGFLAPLIGAGADTDSRLRRDTEQHGLPLGDENDVWGSGFRQGRRVATGRFGGEFWGRAWR